MSLSNPPNTSEVQHVIAERVAALDSMKGVQETVNVEWRGSQIAIPVISMPVDLLQYNPGTHRICAQRSMDPAREQDLDDNSFGQAAQRYLHELLMGDPADPSRIDPSFLALKEDLREFGQNEPGIITRAGVLINGNTRRAALKEIGQKNMRVGVLPPDAGHADLQSIELSLQLRKDHKRAYSFMNFLLAIDERAASDLPAKIQSDFRIKAPTFERSRWILDFVRDAIKRSEVQVGDKKSVSLRLVDFEAHQGKLEELYRAYFSLKQKSPDEAEALREQRLLALSLEKSKTDLRLIEPDFVKRYMQAHLPTTTAGPIQRIPGTSITVPGPSREVQALRQLTTSALRAQSIKRASGAAHPDEVASAVAFLGDLDTSLVKALDYAGKQARVQKRRIAAADRVADACEDLGYAVAAIADARATGNFIAEDLDEALVALKNTRRPPCFSSAGL